jgi:hypothetical protein
MVDSKSCLHVTKTKYVARWCNFVSKSGDTKLPFLFPPLPFLAMKKLKWGYACPRTPRRLSSDVAYSAVKALSGTSPELRSRRETKLSCRLLTVQGMLTDSQAVFWMPAMEECKQNSVPMCDIRL